MITLEDVALEVGCSVNTVSRALNNKPDVNAQTRRRVLEAARRLGYIPNNLAKALVTKSSGLLGLFVGLPMTNPLCARVVEAATQAAAEMGYELLTAATGMTPFIEAIGRLHSRRVEGIVIAFPPQESADVSFLVPVVTAISASTDKLPSVLCNYNEAAFMAARHLQSTGRTSITALVPRQGSLSDEVQIGLGRANCSGREMRFEFVRDDSAASGYDACRKILQQWPETDGIFLVHDLLAPGAYTALKEYGRKMPEEVGIVGCGDFEASAFLHMPLSTVDIGISSVMTNSISALGNLMRDTSAELLRFPFKPLLIVRESSQKTKTGLADSMGITSQHALDGVANR